MSYSILFVDDDVNLLQGISRLLTLERGDITFDIAASGELALELLGKNSYDVLVSDQKMTGMSGLTLLSIVRSKYPETKRVMLSAQVREEVFQEAESLAHKYISKPCDFEMILSEIDGLFK
jgi:DNA-binding NtrC family response regulator